MYFILIGAWNGDFSDTRVYHWVKLAGCGCMSSVTFLHKRHNQVNRHYTAKGRLWSLGLHWNVAAVFWVLSTRLKIACFIYNLQLDYTVRAVHTQTDCCDRYYRIGLQRQKQILLWGSYSLLSTTIRKCVCVHMKLLQFAVSRSLRLQWKIICYWLSY